MVVVKVAVTCAVGWVTRPFVVLLRRGTIDEQRRRTIREEARRVTAVPRATGNETGASAATGNDAGASAATGNEAEASAATLPAPRGALDDSQVTPT